MTDKIQQLKDFRDDEQLLKLFVFLKCNKKFLEEVS